MTFYTTAGIGIVLLHFSIDIILLNGINTVTAAASAKPVQQQQQERIITEISDVWKGVPVDFRYNESDTDSVPPVGGMISVPGCPKSIEGYPWVYYGKPKKCYLAGEQGPCASYQRLFIESGSPYGFCNCECFEGMKMIAGQHEFCKASLDSTEYVFIPKMRKCYALYDQGFCKGNQWLVKSTNKNNKTMAVCETRQCPSGQRPYYSDEDDKNGSHHSSLNFTCFAPYGTYAGPVSIVPNDCEEGAKFSKLLQKCVKKFAFNIG